MRIFQGKGASGGIVIGKVKIYKKRNQQTACHRIEDVEQELVRWGLGKEKTEKQLEELYHRTLQEVGKDEAAIFQVHRLLLEDKEYSNFVESLIRGQKVNAEYAVEAAGKHFSSMFSAMNDEYMQARAVDIRDISQHLIDVLFDKEQMKPWLQEPVILVAEELTPSETIQLDRDKVLAFVTKGGFMNSHTVILARTMGIPALVGTKLSMETIDDGDMGIVDGTNGFFYVEPDNKVLKQFQIKQQENKKRVVQLQQFIGKETITLDGCRVSLRANIGNLKDLELVLQHDGDGIGLFRSECLYLERDSLPSEEEQFQIYKYVIEAMQGKPVVIRTMDIGADKLCASIPLEKEDNPALGYRAIRICLNQPKLFKTQLRALYRAGVYGNLSIMYPMIISVEEVQKIRQLTEEVKAELEAEGIAYGNPRQGIMIETPAAVMISDELAREVDFFSIGTNDLLQYTLAIDRQSAQLASFYNPHHPAVLRMIAMVTENAHNAGIPVGICGELGADMELTGEFLRMGVDELSVSPGSILPMRKRIREMYVAPRGMTIDCQE